MKSLQGLYSYDRTNFICMDLNENSAVASSLIKQLVKHLYTINRYPSETQFTKTVSSHFRVSTDMILPCNGSGEAISLLFQGLMNGQSKVLNTYPSFILYSMWSNLKKVKLIQVRFKPNLDFPFGEFEKKLLQMPDVAIIINPSYPYGKAIEKNYIFSLIKMFSATLFIIDETYIDFGGDSILESVKNESNYIVLRSFSKGFGIAGLRLGFCIGPQILIDKLKTYKLPFSVNSMALAAGEYLIRQYAKLSSSFDNTISKRNLICTKLREYGIYAINTDANFILIKYRKIKKNDQFNLADELKKYTILAKSIPSTTDNDIVSYCRITIGTARENKILVNALVHLFKQYRDEFEFIDPI